MASLHDLFPDGPRVRGDEQIALDDHHTMRRFEQLFGPRRDPFADGRVSTDAGELTRMVDTAVADKTPLDMSAYLAPATGARRKRKVDVILLTASALAVVGLATTATVGAVQLATASPATSALQSLQADEAALQNAFQSVTSATDRLVTEIEAAAQDAAKTRQAIVDTSSAPNPFLEIDEAAQPLQIADPAALVTVLAAIDAYTAGLSAVVVPTPPAEYERRTVDEESLADVAAAIDSAQQQLVEIDTAMAALRATRTEVQTLKTSYTQALQGFASSFPVAAAVTVAAFPDAVEALRSAVTAAAGQVAASDLALPSAATVLARYRDGVVALATDQVRVERERIDAERREQNRGTGGQAPPSAPEPTQPPPVEPDPPVDPPVDPPTDPETPPDGNGTP